MLAKQFWNLMLQPRSLAYRILQAKYIPRSDILNAGLGYNPSYLWRSLLASKNLVHEGMGWRIGDGKSVNVAHDRWIGCENVEPPGSLKNEDLDDQEIDGSAYHVAVSKYSHMHDN